jgi:hypothetical protein
VVQLSPIHEDSELILAAEDCDRAIFSEIHRFTQNDRRIINKLIAHGPVLLQGGRGSGKSALMIAASQEMAPYDPAADVIGIYVSLRHLPLLRSEGEAYESIFCGLLVDEIKKTAHICNVPFESEPNVRSLQYAIANLSATVSKRVVLLFDDAAHIGREASLEEFFSIFRTLSSSSVSCKAAIYPGVTHFGNRFDVYNDATVIDVTRDQDQPEFGELFADVIRARYPALAAAEYVTNLTYERVGRFLGLSVLGNMRGFIFACGKLQDTTTSGAIGLNSLGRVMLLLATNYYWPLLEEVTPKLGKYSPMVEPARILAERLVSECVNRNVLRKSVLIHREFISAMPKPFEILEYVGFLARREASRSLKSGGRGTRYSMNLCLLYEQAPGPRLTSELYMTYERGSNDPLEIHTTSKFPKLLMPIPSTDSELQILKEPVSCLSKSNAYPYGLTQRMVTTLIRAGIDTVRALSEASDEALDALDWVGPATVRRMRNVVGQAVWM